MDCIEAIMTRRSIRSFTHEPVTDAELEVVLRAAMAAPSAGNQQPWWFVVVRDPAVLAQLSEATPYAGMLARAPVGIVVCADTCRGLCPVCGVNWNRETCNHGEAADPRRDALSR